MAKEALQVSIGYPPSWLVNWVKYWLKFKKKRVRVVTKHVHVTNLPNGTRYWRKVYEGTVDDVLGDPAAIILSSVQVRFAGESFILDPAGNESVVPLVPSPAIYSDKQYILQESIEEISFVKYCRKCGSELPAPVKYCTNCGTKQNS